MKKNPLHQSLSSIDDYWNSSPEIVRRFLTQRELYEQLCSEVEYILRKRMIRAKIEFAHTTSRAKTLTSFLEKLSRKQYDDPFVQICDFAGVRVVYLYRSNLATLEKIVSTEFQVVERVDKLHELSPSEFGYGAVHFIVKLGKNNRGARYDDLKALVCEVQIRTVLQDAWAIIDHHLVYKQESDVPSILQRKLNSLAGLFETADDSFNAIRKERLKYISDVERSSKHEVEFLNYELNKDTFMAFLQWKFPDISPYPEELPSQVDYVLRSLRTATGIQYKTIGDINADYEKVKDRADNLFPFLIKSGRFGGTACIKLKYGLSLLHKSILKTSGSSPKFVMAVKRFIESEQFDNKVQ